MKKIICNIIIITAALVAGKAQATSFVPESRAVVSEENYKPHFGLAMGLSDPEGSSDPSGNLALTVGFQPYIPFSVGLEAGYTDFDEESNNLRRTNLLVKGKFNFGGDLFLINKSYVGLGLGPAWEEEAGQNGLAFIMKPEVGFDVPLIKAGAGQIYVGGQVAYQVSSRGTADVLIGNGVISYWY